MKLFLPAILFAAFLSPNQAASQVVVRGGVQVTIPGVGIRVRFGGHGRHLRHSRRPVRSSCRNHGSGHYRLQQVREWVPPRFTYRRDRCGRWVRVIQRPGYYRLVYRRVRYFCR